ncbi:LrgB family protein [Synergistaceae bacterium OttesenSCG-928-I11]|nr:LrgB family protein [Synergistaceae bacterium OttesenSCG-928-I11]
MERFFLSLDAALASPFFGISLTIFCYAVGKWANARYRSPITSPYIVALVLVVGALHFGRIPLSHYRSGADLLTMMLVPATAILGTTIYSRRAFLRQNFVPLVVGGLVGSATSLASVWLLSRALGLDRTVALSMMPRSVTTPIALELAAISGGIMPIAILSVLLTGMCGVVFGPVITKLMGITDPLAVGAAYGVASHVVGTSKAVEIGETEGAAGSVSICVAGMITVALYMMFLV